jgi:hypothetical protein
VLSWYLTAHKSSRMPSPSITQPHYNLPGNVKDAMMPIPFHSTTLESLKSVLHCICCTVRDTEQRNAPRSQAHHRIHPILAPSRRGVQVYEIAVQVHGTAQRRKGEAQECIDLPRMLSTITVSRLVPFVLRAVLQVQRRSGAAVCLTYCL